MGALPDPFTNWQLMRANPLTICCGLFCTASKILGALQAILHITCIFGVLQPPKCGSSVKKNAGLISPPPCFEPPRPWPPPPPARAPARSAVPGGARKKAAFCHRAPFSGQKRLFFRAGAGKNRLYSERPDGLQRAPRPSPGKTSPQQSGAARGGAGRRGEVEQQAKQESPAGVSGAPCGPRGRRPF